MRPRILVLTSTYPRWTGDHEPRFVHELSRRLASELEVHVLAPHARGAKDDEVMDGVHVHRFHYAPERLETLAYEGGILAHLRERRLRLLLIPLFLLAEILAIRRLLRAQAFAAIHAHWILPQGLAALVAMAGYSARIPIICTSHGADLFGLRSRIATSLKAWVLRRCAAVTVVSDAMAREVQRIAPGIQAAVIPMGTDFDARFRPDPTVERDPAQVLFVGRLVEKKGVKYLLHALASLKEQRPALCLDIAGYGQEERELRQLCTELGIEGSVRFLGPVQQDSLPDLYRRAGVTVVPSVVAAGGDQEGFGLVIVEAIGCGCPVIASDLPAIRHIAGEGGEVMLSPPEDPTALARAMDAVLAHHDQYLHTTSAFRTRIANQFGWDSASAAYAGLIFQSIGPSHATEATVDANH